MRDITIAYILSFLCDDDETLETIISMLNYPNKEDYNLENVLPVILDLYCKEMLTIEYPRDVKEIDMGKLGEYWFSITKKGKEFFKENNPF